MSGLCHWPRKGPERRGQLSYIVSLTHVKDLHVSGFLSSYIYVLVQYCGIMINNFVALWRLGPRDILELPLLAASSKMETAPMPGKT